MNGFDKIRERLRAIIDGNGRWHMAETITIGTQDFFSSQYEGEGDLFEGLSIWEEEKYRVLQGTYPVISLSFASVKEKSYTETRIG